jgi:hypothetical protein
LPRSQNRIGHLSTPPSPSTMSRLTHHSQTILDTPRQTRRPASIAELAQHARDDLDIDDRELKFHLRNAEKYRRTGKELVSSGNLEAAFVEFAKAASLVLETLPAHRDYRALLSREQRHNLSLVRAPFARSQFKGCNMFASVAFNAPSVALSKLNVKSPHRNLSSTRSLFILTPE